MRFSIASTARAPCQLKRTWRREKKNEKILITIAAVSALAAGAPALAQNRGGNFDNRIEALQGQLQQGIQRGTISRNEAAPLRDRLRQLSQLERQYSRGGFNQREQNTLQQRTQSLRQQIQFAERSGQRGNNDHRGDGRRGGR